MIFRPPLAKYLFTPGDLPKSRALHRLPVFRRRCGGCGCGKTASSTPNPGIVGPLSNLVCSDGVRIGMEGVEQDVALFWHNDGGRECQQGSFGTAPRRSGSDAHSAGRNCVPSNRGCESRGRQPSSLRDLNFYQVPVERKRHSSTEMNHSFEYSKCDRRRCIENRGSLLVPTPACLFCSFARQVFSHVVWRIGADSPQGSMTRRQA